MKSEQRLGDALAPFIPPSRDSGNLAARQFEAFFKKFIDNKLTRGGGLLGNWNMNEQQSAMLYALALDPDSAYEDGKGRRHYVRDKLLEKASRATVHMLHSNGFVTNFGDSSYTRMWGEQLELLLAYYTAKGDKASAGKCAPLLAILFKLGVQNTAGAITRAFELGLLRA